MRLFEVQKSKSLPKTLKEEFEIQPFSLLDAKSGYWMSRKQEWEKILQDKNDVRAETTNGNTTFKNVFDDTERYYGLKNNGSVSGFDPFLTEILVKWFSRPGDLILDPFAGRVVRGGIAAILGRDYYGIDISPTPVEHNRKRFAEICESLDVSNNAEWVCDNSLWHEFPKDKTFKMMLTCPPYYDVERYTDNPQDLSNINTYEGFMQQLVVIADKCYDALAENSFAAIVVAEIRDKDGAMRGFVADVINSFQHAGFHYYNEMILENRIVSLSVRCTKYFRQSRKVGRHHQNVLIFYKGDVTKIKEEFIWEA